MNTLQQAREAGYSDEEIISHISTKEPEWANKYKMAKDAGYSDDEILQKRYERIARENELAQQNKEQMQQQRLEEVVEEQVKVGQTEDQEVSQPESKSLYSQPLLGEPIQKAIEGGFFGEAVKKGYENIPERKPLTDEEKQQIYSGAGLKNMLSGATLGLSENIPGLGLSDKERENLMASETLGGWLAGFLPVETAIKWVANPITRKTAQWASASPYGKQILTSLGRLTGIGTAGAALEGTEKVFKGELPDLETMAEQGSEWIALDLLLSGLGKTGSFVKSLLNKSKKINKPSAKVLRDTVNKMRERGVDFSDSERASTVALDIVEDLSQPYQKITSTDLKDSKISDKSTKRMIQDSSKLTESLPENLDATDLIKRAEEAYPQEILDSISPRAETELELGNSIKNGIDAEIQKAKDVYNPLYDSSENIAKGIETLPEDSIDTAKTILEDLKSLKTKPSGYQTVINTLETSIKDLGETSTKLGTTTEEVSVSKMMELKRRLSEIVDYDVLDWTIKKKLTPLIKSLKNEINDTLRLNNREAFLNWNSAEKTYAQSADRLKTQNIRKIRGETRPERIANDIKSPSVLKELKEALPSDIYAQTEREVLEQINAASYDKAKSIQREMSKSLSKEANAAAEKLVESKRATTQRNRAKVAQDSVLDELASSYEKGIRPKNTLDLWKTDRGQTIVRDALKGSPNKNEIIEYLNKQSVKDVIKTLLDKEGSIDYTKVNKVVRDRGSRQMMERVGGKEAVMFLGQLEQLAKQMESNLRRKATIFETKTPTTKGAGDRGKELIRKRARKNAPIEALIDDYAKKFGISSPYKIKYLLAGLGVGAAPKIAATAFTARVLYKMMNTPRLRKALKDAGSRKISPEAMGALINIILSSVDEEDE